MKYSPRLLLPQLSPVIECRRLVVAFSGGLDSMVLLHSLHELALEGKLTQKITAIHINHGINPAASDWQAFCEATCKRLEISVQTVQLNLAKQANDNLEERARIARYQEFERLLEAGDCLLMGHHRDDQMETLLLRLMRGSGPGGLAGIPATRALGESRLLRPLLVFDRSALRQFAIQQELNWVEDDSNQSVDFDRNFLRHEVLPLIETRWPGYRESWDKSLQLNSEASELLKQLATLDLSAMSTNQPQVINLRPLRELSEPRQRNLLRYWLETIGFPDPGWQQLLKLTREIIPIRRGANARLSLGGGSLRRFQDKLYALSDKLELSASELDWNLTRKTAFSLPGNGELRLIKDNKEASRKDRNFTLRTDIKTVTVKYRSGGEKFRPTGRPTKSLKSLLQEKAIPPWLRKRYPLLFVGNELIMVPGIGVAEKFAARESEFGHVVSWEPPDLLYSP